MTADTNKMMGLLKEEMPLIAFTTCAPAAVGVALFALVAGIVELSLQGTWTSGWKLACVAVIYTTVGMAASVLHLARPLRAPRSLSNVESSWLSREILAVSAFWFVLVLWLLFALVAAGILPFASSQGAAMSVISLGVCAVACLAGVFLIYVIARAYRVHGQSGWNGPETVIELIACVFRVGILSAACVMLLDGKLFLPWVACALGCAGFAVAIVLDSVARDARLKRLEGELSDGANPYGRVPAAMHQLKGWEEERTLGTLVSAAGAVFLALAFFIPALTSIAVICAIICALVSQAIMRATFYSLCDPSRTVPRFL